MKSDTEEKWSHHATVVLMKVQIIVTRLEHDRSERPVRPARSMYK